MVVVVVVVMMMIGGSGSGSGAGGGDGEQHDALVRLEAREGTEMHTANVCAATHTVTTS